MNEWATRGNTDIDTLTLACAPNHKLIETGCTTTQFPNYRTAWLPPARFDRGGSRTNSYHHPERLLNDGDDERAGP
jgi:hypothetical protein